MIRRGPLNDGLNERQSNRTVTVPLTLILLILLSTRLRDEY